jgi:uncharacterized protein
MKTVHDNYVIYERDHEYVLFDPLTLESAFLTSDETSLLENSPNPESTEIYTKLLKFGFSSLTPQKLSNEDYVRNFLSERLSQNKISGEPTKIGSLRILVTDRCNLNCTYCFVDINSGNPDMSMEDLRSGLYYLFSQNANSKEVYIQWFGGEPTLRFDLIKYGDNLAQDLQKQFSVEKVTRGIVTNAVSISDEMIEHFSQYNYGIGISIDGTPEINSKNRFLPNGKGSDEKIISNLKKLKPLAERRQLYVGINLTPTEENVDHISDIVSYFIDKLGVKFIYINSPIPSAGKWWISGKSLAKSLYKARLIALSKGGMVFSALDRIYQAIDSRIPTVFEHLQGDGSLQAMLLPNAKISLYYINWKDSNYLFSIDQLCNSPDLLNIAAKKLLPVKECCECPAMAICGGPSNDDISHRQTPKPDPEHCAFFQTGLELALWDTTSIQ